MCVNRSAAGGLARGGGPVRLRCTRPTAHHLARPLSSRRAALRPRDAAIASPPPADVPADAVIHLDDVGRIAGWGVGAARLLGYTGAEIIGRPAGVLVAPGGEAAGGVARGLTDASRGGEAGVDAWLVRRDGGRFRAAGVALALPAGGSLLVVRDVSAEREAEAGRERLRLALDAARLGTWRWDVLADAHTRDEVLNRMIGLPPDAGPMPIEGFLAAMHPEDRPAVREAFARCVEAGVSLQIDFRVVRPDGVRWLRDQGDAFGRPGGGPFYLTGACLDITDRKAMEDALRRARDELEDRVRERTAELAAAVQALRVEAAERKVAVDARQELLGRLVDAQEEERRRIARELHDSLGQYLAAMSLGLARAREQGGAAAAGLDHLDDLTAEIGREVHRVAIELRPTALDDIGLAGALQNYVDVWSARARVPAEFIARGLGAERFPPEVTIAAYRVVQESLTNVLKHAAAARVSVLAERHPGHLSVIVEDDGRGFDPDRPGGPRAAGGLGLLGMRERVALVGGELQIESAPGAGTTVYARMPVG